METEKNNEENPVESSKNSHVSNSIEEPKYGEFQYIFDTRENYLRDMNYEKSIIYTKKLLYFYPSNTELYLDLAEYYLHLFDVSTAITYLKKSLILSTNEMNIKNELNNALFAKGLIMLIASNKIEYDYDYLSKIKYNLQSKDIFYIRAKAYLSLNLINEAIAELNKILIEDKNNELALVLLGKILINKGSKIEGEKLMWKATEINPQNEEIKQFTKIMKNLMDEVIKKANAYILKGRLKIGLLLSFKALKIYPNHPEALLLRSSIYKSMGMSKEAISDLNHAKEECKKMDLYSANPQLENYIQGFLSDIYNDIAIKYIDSNHLKDAMGVIVEALNNKSDDFTAHLNKGDCLMKMKDIMNAKEEYLVCLKIKETSVVAKTRLAHVYHKLAIFSYNSKDYLEALELLNQAIEYYKKYDFIFVLKARTEIKLGMIQEAYNDASLAYLINPKNQDAIEIRKYLS